MQDVCGVRCSSLSQSRCPKCDLEKLNPGMDHHGQISIMPSLLPSPPPRRLYTVQYKVTLFSPYLTCVRGAFVRPSLCVKQSARLWGHNSERSCSPCVFSPLEALVKQRGPYPLAKMLRWGRPSLTRAHRGGW